MEGLSKPMDAVLSSILQLFLLGYATTVSAEVLSYPTDTVRRRMMMTSEEAVKYEGSVQCAKCIIKQASDENSCY